MLLSRYTGRRALLIPALLIALVVWTVLTSGHGPGDGGRGAFATVLLGIGLVTYAVWALRPKGGRYITAAVVIQAAAGGLLLGAAPDSAASALIFVAVISASMRSEGQGGWVVVAIGTLALAAGTILYNESAVGFLAYVLGFAAARLAATNARQSIARAEQAELLLAQAQRSREEALRAARLEESTRIARDIHDVLAHTLAGLTIQLEATRALVERGADRDTVLHRVDQAHRLARDGLRETRRAVGVLRDQAVPLGQGLRELVDSYADAGDVAPELTVAGEPDRIDPRAGQEMLRIAQEALTNARKHAAGAPVRMRLSVEEARARLIVANELPAGAAVTALGRSGGGYGLRGMQERAQLLGGTVTAGPDTDGWRVELNVPLSAGHE